ncbi:hypothetical protein [Vallicoccus soli]|nr:hypothetical protein [Vallicoccus soli]
MLSALSAVAAESEEHVNELPAEPLWLGIGAFGVLLLLLLVTLSFNRQR